MEVYEDQHFAEGCVSSWLGQVVVHLCTPSQFIQLPHAQVHLVQIVIATCLLDCFSDFLY